MQGIKKRMVITGAVLLITFLLLGGCANGGAQKEESAGPVYQNVTIDIMGNDVTIYTEKTGSEFYLEYVFLNNEVYANGTIEADGSWTVTETNMDFVTGTIEILVPEIDPDGWLPVTEDTIKGDRETTGEETIVTIEIDGKPFEVSVYVNGDSVSFSYFGNEQYGDLLASGSIDTDGTWKINSFSAGWLDGSDWTPDETTNARKDEITEQVYSAYRSDH